MQQHWAGLGGGGLIVSYDIIRNLYNDGSIQINDGSSDQSSKPPISTGSEGDEEKYKSYISTPDGKINITYYGMDSDDQILSSLEEVDEDDYNNILRKHENYIHLLQGRGAGTGGVPKRIIELAESNKQIKNWIRDVTSDLSGVFNPIFSLDGGSGFGFFKLHTKMMSSGGEIDQPSSVIPLAISPHRTEANRKVSWAERDISRNASDNVDLATEYIGDRIGGNGGLIDTCILVDNDFAAFNQVCNMTHDYDYEYVFEKTLPILEDLDFSKFNSSAKNNLNHEHANHGIARSVEPLYQMLTRGPRGEKFGKTNQSGFDHNDVSGMFGNYVVPSGLTLTSKNRVADIFGSYELDGYEEKLAYLSYYAFLMSCAPMNGDDITDVTIFVWDGGQTQSIGGQIKEGILNLFSEVGIDSDDISVHPVVGIADPNAELKIWTYSSVEEMRTTLNKKFH